MNTVREELGDKKFDKLFGSNNSHEDHAIPAGQRLTISTGLYTTPLVDNTLARHQVAIDGRHVLITQVRKQFLLMTGKEMPSINIEK